MAHHVKENEELRVAELEQYKRSRIQGLKEKDDKNIRNIVIAILSIIALQWAASLEMVVDIVHWLGGREEEKHHQAIMQFVMRYHRDATYKMSKNCKTCKDLGIHFKQDFCKAE